MKAGTKWGDGSLARKLLKMVRKGKRAAAKYHLARVAPKRGKSRWNPGYMLGID